MRRKQVKSELILSTFCCTVDRTLVKTVYRKTIFLISQPKHML